MDSSFSAPPQSYSIYDHSQWTEEMKAQFVAEHNEHGLGDVSIESISNNTAAVAPTLTRRQSSLKVEDEIAANEQMWHDRLPESQTQMRHFSQSHMMNGHGQHMIRIQDPNTYVAAVAHHAQWPTTQSGSSTPTPIYGSMDSYGSVAFSHGPSAFATYSQDPNSAVAMSPQSSQGGWASGTSSDGVEQRGMMQSPTYRAPSPTMVVRSDGIRKKNARFEIPKERNLSNIDAMIQQSTDENEKKELKQQKRLLRNRQAALDSRQRKKTHTEKLEQEKKVSEKKMFDMEEALARMEAQLNLERGEWHQQRQHMEQYIHSLQYERDEAIRQKTVETSDLRRQNNALKDCVKELERQPHRGYAPTSTVDGFGGGGFNEYALDEGWEEFSLIERDDEFKMDESEQLNQQATPKPPVTQSMSDIKSENGFSGNTFYMCLLFGAFLAANWTNNAPANTTTSAIASSISPSEAGNVLRAVLKSSDTDIVPAQIQMHGDETTNIAHTSLVETGAEPSSTSSLDSLHQTLTVPSRRQELQAAFSLSASAYNHIINPFNEHMQDEDHHLLAPTKPSAFQQAVATMQAQKDEMERQNGISAKLRERSALWDQVPAQVVKDFQALVKNSKVISTTNSSGEEMEH